MNCIALVCVLRTSANGSLHEPILLDDYYKISGGDDWKKRVSECMPNNVRDSNRRKHTGYDKCDAWKGRVLYINRFIVKKQALLNTF